MTDKGGVARMVRLLCTVVPVPWGRDPCLTRLVVNSSYSFPQQCMSNTAPR
jgi:hypothetical protein